MSNNEKYREAYDMLCEYSGSHTWKKLEHWSLESWIPCTVDSLAKWLLDSKGLKVDYKDNIYLQDVQKAINDQKEPVYNPVKNISSSKYLRCTKNHNGCDLYLSSKSGCVWMWKSFCNKYYYWSDYNANNEVIYFRGEVDWVKDNYDPYKSDDTSTFGYGVLASFSVAEDAFDFSDHNDYVKDIPEVKSLVKTEWTDKHYDFNYTLTEDDIENGFVKLDVYKVAKVWRTGSKDDSGALWHSLKTIARFGEKNTVEREVKALYEQVKGLARENGVTLE